MNMNINSLSQKYSVRKLDENDVDIIYDMSINISYLVIHIASCFNL